MISAARSAASVSYNAERPSQTRQFTHTHWQASTLELVTLLVDVCLECVRLPSYSGSTIAGTDQASSVDADTYVRILKQALRRHTLSRHCGHVHVDSNAPSAAVLLRSPTSIDCGSVAAGSCEYGAPSPSRRGASDGYANSFQRSVQHSRCAQS